MRIRKRKVPFPLSSLSPVPLSDPHLNTSPPIELLQLHHTIPQHNFSYQDDIPSLFASHSSDHPPNHPIGGQDCYFTASNQQQNKVLLLDEEKGGDAEGEKTIRNDTRYGYFLGAKTPTMVFQESISLHQDGRCYEEEKAFPFKKRRGNFERRSNEVTVMEEDNDKQMKTQMRTKMSKKCMQHDDNEEGGGGDDDEIKELVVDRGNGISSGRKRVRGGALMEGSRCSRVNGRGWRCCQQTLVGYSLCEHHLGKGRLRSMTSVRSRSMANAAANKGESQTLSNPSASSLAGEGKTKGITSLHDKVGVVYGDEKEERKNKKPLMIAKKKQKLGMVKARSMSSLLGQANNVIEVSESDE